MFSEHLNWLLLSTRSTSLAELFLEEARDAHAILFHIFFIQYSSFCCTFTSVLNYFFLYQTVCSWGNCPFCDFCSFWGSITHYVSNRGKFSVFSTGHFPHPLMISHGVHIYTISSTPHWIKNTVILCPICNELLKCLKDETLWVVKQYTLFHSFTEYLHPAVMRD